MMKLEVNTKGFDEVRERLKLLKFALSEKGVQNWFNELLGDGDISIQTTLRDNIMDLVYMQPVEMIVGGNYRVVNEPNFYERTERLYQATKVVQRGNKIHLFMDDGALRTRGSVLDVSKGTATNLDTKPYSLRVENDFIYENRIGQDVLRKGSKYMEKTYNEIKEDILNGRRSPKSIITPILGVWRG